MVLFCTLMVLAPLVPVLCRNTILSYGIRSIFSSFLVQWEQLRFVVTISSFLALSPLPVILLNPRNNLPLPARDNGSILKHLKSQHPVFTYLRDPYLYYKRFGLKVKMNTWGYPILWDGNKSPHGVLKCTVGTAIISISYSITAVLFLPAEAQCEEK